MKTAVPLEKYFKASEFNCKCGKCGMGLKDMKPDLLASLVAMREDAGVPFAITSAIRCAAHNKAVGGEPDSAHMRGYAVDITATTSRIRFRILQAAIRYNIKRIGIYKTFIHVDVDPTLPSDVCWRG